jgi:hypothetical protein
MNDIEILAEKSLNIKLVNSLIQIIRTLSPEERQILEEELFFDNSEPSNQEIAKLAEMGNSFNFIQDEPDIYTLEDGEPV